jgi:hypothetical protein
MPGVDLNLDLPSLSDNLSDIVSKIVIALAAIEDDLADDVTPSEFNVNTALSLAGNTLTNAGSVLLVSGNVPSAAGSIYYDSGEFYAIDSTGVIQLTDAGNLNAASLGTIGGDFGGANPAQVTYDDASGEYRFTEDTGVYADLVADDVVLMGASGSVRLGVAAGITTARQFLFDDLPTSGITLLAYDSATSTVEDAGNVTLDVDITTTGPVTAATLVVTTEIDATTAGIDIGDAGIRHGEHVLSQRMGAGFHYDGVGGITHGTYGEITCPFGASFLIHVLGLERGKRVTKIKVTGNDASSPLAGSTFIVSRCNSDGTETTQAHTSSRSGALGGPFEYTLTITSPFILDTGHSVVLAMAPTSAGSATYYTLSTYFDQIP